MRCTVGLDIGTTSTIGVLIRADGLLVAECSRPVTLYSDHPGWSEEDAEQWWQNACAVLRELAATAGAQGLPIEAVGVTGMLPAIVLLDESGRTIRRSIQQSDARAAVEVEELRASVDPAAFFDRTGVGINQQLVAPRLRWIEKHEPQAFRRIATVFGSYDYINFRLTRARAIEQNWALESGMMELDSRAFAPDLVALGGISPSVLPPIRASDALIGAVTPEAARETGVAESTPVVAGCADLVGSAFAAGVVEEGDFLLKFGGSGDILAASKRRIAEPRLFLDYHLVPGLYLPNGCMAVSGGILNWFVQELAPDLAAGRDKPHAKLDEAAAATVPGAEGLVLLPYFLGEKTPLHDPLARGTIVGLGLHHTRAHLWRALLEGIAFGFRHHVEMFEAAGLPPRRFVASDGGSSSALWMQITADVLQRPIQLLEGHSGSSLGAAFVAGKGVGIFENWAEVARFVRLGTVVNPRPETAMVYDRLYHAYRDIYRRLQDLYPALSQ